MAVCLATCRILTQVWLTVLGSSDIHFHKGHKHGGSQTVCLIRDHILHPTQVSTDHFRLQRPLKVRLQCRSQACFRRVWLLSPKTQRSHSFAFSPPRADQEA